MAKLKRIFLTILFSVLFVPIALANKQEQIVRAVMNEAEGETYESKLAHAFMFLNRTRAGMNLGSSGLLSARVRSRLARAGDRAWSDARRAVDCAFDSCVPDPTFGAVYCENVKQFGVPEHIIRAGKNVVPTVRVGDVQFWRKK